MQTCFVFCLEVDMSTLFEDPDSEGYLSEGSPPPDLGAGEGRGPVVGAKEWMSQVATASLRSPAALDCTAEEGAAAAGAGFWVKAPPPLPQGEERGEGGEAPTQPNGRDPPGCPKRSPGGGPHADDRWGGGPVAVRRGGGGTSEGRGGGGHLGRGGEGVTSSLGALFAKKGGKGREEACGDWHPPPGPSFSRRCRRKTLARCLKGSGKRLSDRSVSIGKSSLRFAFNRFLSIQNKNANWRFYSLVFARY